MRTLIFLILMSSGRYLNAQETPQPSTRHCILPSYPVFIPDAPQSLVTVAISSNGKVQIIDCEPIEIGSASYAIWLGESQIAGLEMHHERNGDWRPRIQLEDGSWFWLSYDGGGLCLPAQQSNCAIEIIGTMPNNRENLLISLIIKTQTERRFDAPIKWFREPKLLRIY